MPQRLINELRRKVRKINVQGSEKMDNVVHLNGHMDDISPAFEFNLLHSTLPRGFHVQVSADNTESGREMLKRFIGAFDGAEKPRLIHLAHGQLTYEFWPRSYPKALAKSRVQALHQSGSKILERRL